MENVAVVGWAQSDQSDVSTLDTRHSLVYKVITEALVSAGLSIQDIDIVFSTGSDVVDGGRVSACDMVGALGGHFREEFKIAGDGLQAVMLAQMRISSGFYNTALIVAYSRNSENRYGHKGRKMSDPFFHRPLGIDELAVGALQERAYLHRFHIETGDVAEVAVRNRKSGARNPYAMLREPVLLEDVMSSPEIMSPIREMEISPSSEGACAIILAEEKSAKSMGRKLAWISGSANITESFQPGSEEITYAYSAAEATGRAYKAAGVEDPASELDVIEMGYQYAYQELMLYEAAGLCGHGEGPTFLRAVADGSAGLEANPSGGSICADPQLATGLIRLAEAAAQVTGQADERQVPGARKALAIIATGMAIQSTGCILVER
ncbi:MAG: thiolase family protein [Actinobacteria bacterium]|nr:thiolase family protein [Actinomycetota bacterium]